jgi:hypothetical protein
MADAPQGPGVIEFDVSDALKEIGRLTAAFARMHGQGTKATKDLTTAFQAQQIVMEGLSAEQRKAATEFVRLQKQQERAVRESTKAQAAEAEKQQKYLRELRLRANADQAKADKAAADAAAEIPGALVAGFTAGLAAVVAATAGISELAAKVDQLSDVAARANLGVDTVEALGQAAAQGGGSLSDLTGLLNQFVRRTTDAAKGSGEIAESFKQLGIAAKDSEGNLRDSDAVFRDAVKTIGSIEDPTQRAAAAFAIFGEGAGPLLETGILNSTTALEGLIDGANRFGISSAPGAADAANQWQKQMAILEQSFDGASAQLLELIGPFVSQRLKEFTYTLASVRELGALPLKIAMEGLSSGINSLKLIASSTSLGELEENFKAATEQAQAGSKALLEQADAAFKNLKALELQQIGYVQVTEAEREEQGWAKLGLGIKKELVIVDEEAEERKRKAIEAAKRHASELERLHDKILGVAEATEESIDPFVELQHTLEDIADAEKKGAINAEEAARARAAASAKFTKAELAEQDKRLKAAEAAQKKIDGLSADATDSYQNAIKERAEAAEDGVEDVSDIERAALLEQQAEQIAYVEKIREIQAELAEILAMPYADAPAAQKAANDAMVAAEEEHAAKVEGIKREAAQRTTDLQMESFEAGLGYANEFASGISDLFGEITEARAQKISDLEDAIGEAEEAGNKQKASRLKKQLKAEKEAATESFERQKAASTVAAFINIAEGVTKALAAAPPPINFGLAALTAAAGATEVAAIANAKPSFHSGTSGQAGEYDATLLRGEPVLTREAGSTLGPTAIDALNAGRGGPLEVVVKGWDVDPGAMRPIPVADVGSIAGAAYYGASVARTKRQRGKPKGARRSGQARRRR